MGEWGGGEGTTFLLKSLEILGFHPNISTDSAKMFGCPIMGRVGWEKSKVPLAPALYAYVGLILQIHVV